MSPHSSLLYRRRLAVDDRRHRSVGVLAAVLHGRVQSLVGPGESVAGPEQQRLHGRLRCLQHLRDLLIAATFHLAKEQRQVLSCRYRGERFPCEAYAFRL